MNKINTIEKINAEYLAMTKADKIVLHWYTENSYSCPPCVQRLTQIARKNEIDASASDIRKAFQRVEKCVENITLYS